MNGDVLKRLQQVEGDGSPLVVDAMIDIQCLRDGSKAAVEQRTRAIMAYLRDHAGAYGLVISRVIAEEFLGEDP